MSVAGEATRRGNVDQREGAARHEVPSLGETQLHQVSVRRLSGRCTKRPQEMGPAVTRLGGQRRQVQIRRQDLSPVPNVVELSALHFLGSGR